MTRPLRSFYDDQTYHVYARGVRRQDIFLCREDCAFFFARIEEYRPGFDVRILEGTLMPNHFHLEMRGTQISDFMHHLLTAYACYFNQRYGRTGHLFERRFNAKPCGSDRYVIALSRYILMNPVRAGFVRHPRDWPYCSWSQVQSGEKRGIVDLAEREMLLGSAGSTRSAIADVCARYAAKPLQPAPAMLLSGVDRASEVLARLAMETLQETGLSLEDLRRSRDGGVAYARRRFVRKASDEGISQTAIAVFLECSRGAVQLLLK